MSARHNLSPCNAANNLEALQQAAQNWDTEMIAELLKNGADYKAKNKRGETVLHFALKNNPANDSEILRLIETFRLFYEAGLNFSAEDVSGRPVLYIAFDKGLIQRSKMLIEWGANMNEPNDYSYTIAHFLVISYRLNYNLDRFIEWRDTYCVDWLLSKGLDVDYKNKYGNTASHLAAIQELPHVLLTLLKYSKNANTINKYGKTILHILVENDALLSDVVNVSSTTKFTKFLLEKCSVDAVDFAGKTPVHIAARRKRLDLVRSMLDNFTNVNAQNIHRETVLLILIAVCKDEDLENVEEMIDLISILVAEGTNIHAKRKDARTPIQLAAVRKHTRILKLLISLGANVGEFDKEGSLLHLVCNNANNPLKDVKYAELIDLLISKGLDVDAKDVHGNTPLHLASVTATVAVIQRLIEHGADVESRENSGYFTPLHLAVKSNRAHPISTLVYSKADANAKDSTGRTPLHWAAMSETTRLLLELDANINVKDDERQSPLDYAIRGHNPTAVQALLEFGADINDVLDVEYIDENLRIFPCAMEHWYKMKTAMLPADDRYKRYEKRISSEFCQECVREVETLKSTPIDNRKSLYDFLHMSHNARCSYTNDAKFCKLVTTSEFAGKFPKYHVLLLAQYREAVKRKPLLKKAFRNWFEITNVSLPDICMYNIFDHLTNEDLKSFSEKSAIEHSCVKENFESFKRLKYF